MENKRVRAKVHMLPTETPTPLITCLKYKHDGKLLPKGDVRVLSTTYNSEELVREGYEYQHLYFTTDKKIVEGDWCIDLISVQLGGQPRLVRASREFARDTPAGEDAFKIVASTDKSLGLPQPSQAFIEKYVELGGIDEVDLEYEEYRAMLGVDIDDNTKINYSEPWYEIKVDSTHNTVTIHSIKDSWSREELTDILQVYRLDYEQYKRSCHYGPNQKEMVDWSNKWIKENL